MSRASMRRQIGLSFGAVGNQLKSRSSHQIFFQACLQLIGLCMNYNAGKYNLRGFKFDEETCAMNP